MRTIFLRNLLMDLMIIDFSMEDRGEGEGRSGERGGRGGKLQNKI
jgi:hypothetical protein